VIQGVVTGCEQAQLILVGGETAEMPDLYAPGEYDLAGFAVGEVSPAHVLPLSKKIRPGLDLIGIASSGCHSNGYSLLRKLLPQSGSKRKKLAKELLQPTQMYVRAVVPGLQAREFLGLAHITGSGFLNVPRISESVGYEIELPALEQRPEIYRWVYERSGLGLSELSQTFNLGIGMVAAVEPKHSAAAIRRIQKSGCQAHLIGKTVTGRGEVRVYDPAFGSDVLLKD
jgi:phosphoribosylformylglycinamidine cyclo-ligase